MESNDLIRRGELIETVINSDLPNSFKDALVSVIRCARKVDAVPVIRGRWLDSVSGEQVIKCSECKSKYYVGATKKNTKQYKFCPNCGTRMKGEDKQNESNT